MNSMNAQEIELQIPHPKPRSRKSTVFGRSPREEDMIIPENSINNYPAPSTSSQSSRSRQVSGRCQCLSMKSFVTDIIATESN